MAQEIIINAEPRDCSGSTAARRLRRAGIIPAVVKKTGGESVMLQLNAHDFERTMSRHANTQLLVSLVVDGNACMALLREIQRDSLTGRITHADFGEIDATHKTHVQIQLVLDGEPEGVKNQGGVLEQMLRHIDVSCLPADVVETFHVDVSALKLGENLTVAELKLGDAYTLVTHADLVVAMVADPSAETEAAAEGDAQPELSVKKGAKTDE